MFSSNIFSWLIQLNLLTWYYQIVTSWQKNKIPLTPNLILFKLKILKLFNMITLNITKYKTHFPKQKKKLLVTFIRKSSKSVPENFVVSHLKLNWFHSHHGKTSDKGCSTSVLYLLFSPTFSTEYHIHFCRIVHIYISDGESWWAFQCPPNVDTWNFLVYYPNSGALVYLYCIFLNESFIWLVHSLDDVITLIYSFRLVLCSHFENISVCH